MSKIYTTVQGDQWDTVAYTQLGSCSRTGELIALNAQYLADYACAFPAGVTLELPETDNKTQTVANLPVWKR